MKNIQGKKLIMTMLLIATLLIPVTTSANALPYSDVTPGNTHYPGIQWVTERGISGYPDGRYGREEPLSREHAARFFTLVKDMPLLDSREVTRYFTDVGPQHDYANYIATVGWARIFTGDTNERFNPESYLSRQQMATVLVNAYGSQSEGEKTPVRLDNVGESHRANVQTIADLNITTELEDFRPSEPVTREQFATFLHRSYMHTQNETEMELEEIKPEPAPNPVPEEPPMEDRDVVINKVQYFVDFGRVVNGQMTVAPQTDSNWVWYNAGPALTAYYLNSNNFTEEDPEFYQYLKLTEPAGLDADEVNQYILNGKGILEGTGEYFIEAGKRYGLNEVYLIVHALLETGNGNSTLANGVKVDGETVYNMFGIGAYDACPTTCGSERAYEEGWFTPGEAILGGAKFVSDNYLNQGQDTLYKMRWNPDGLITSGYRPTHQYATDVGWATKQARTMHRFYQALNNYSLTFEVPTYNNQPAKTTRPFGEAEFAIDTSNQGDSYTTIANLNVRSAPSTAYNIITTLPKGTKVVILGKNTGWFKVRGNGHTGWVSSSYLK